MKNIFTYALAILAAVVLAAGAVCIGAVNGWQNERVQASTLGENNQELASLLDTRSMDAANLAVVASRHLPADDKQLCMLRDAQAVLASGKGSMEELLAAAETHPGRGRKRESAVCRRRRAVQPANELVAHRSAGDGAGR